MCYTYIMYTYTCKFNSEIHMTMITTMDVSLDDRHTFKYGVLSCWSDTWKDVWKKGQLICIYDGRLRSDKPTHHITYFCTKWSKDERLDFLVVMKEESIALWNKLAEDWCHLDRTTHLLVINHPCHMTARNSKGCTHWTSMVRGRRY